MKKLNLMEKSEIDKLIEAYPADDDVVWDPDKVKIDGVMYFSDQKYNADGQGTKMTAESLIKKAPEFDYGFMEEVYSILEEKGYNDVKVSNPNYVSGQLNCCGDAQYEFDLKAAYPTILKYEKLPVDGQLYRKYDKEHMNFFAVESGCICKNCMVTDDLAWYIKNHGGKVHFLFGTDYQIGSKIGDKLHAMAHKNKKTDNERKIKYGVWERRYLEKRDDCYVRRPICTHQLLMVAIKSQRDYVLMNVRDYSGNDKGRYKTDAYYCQDMKWQEVADKMAENFPNYEFRIFDHWKNKDEQIIYKNYADLPDAPRSHHKKCTKTEA